MEVKKITPRGYCYGVVDSMVLVHNVALDESYPRPIYILGMIVHNKHVVEAFNKLGVISLDGEDRLSLIEQIDTGTVIFTAHGVSPEIKRRAKEKNLTLVDATCPDVTKTHKLIEEKTSQDFEIIYIGKKGHPEPEGAIGVVPKKVHLVENVEDVKNLQISNTKVFVTNQTTMSQWDILSIKDEVIKKYPNAEIHNEICMATQKRQEAVANQTRESDLVIVVGDPRSNNTNKLAKVAEQTAGVKAYRIADLSELNIEWLKGKKSVAVTAGASTPTLLTSEVIHFLEQFNENDLNTWIKNRTADLSKILPKVKKRNNKE